MRKVLFGILLTGALNVFAEDMQIRISPEQIDNLAIKVGAMAPGRYIPLLSAPAKVVVPADKEILLSTPQPGLLTQLRANIGDKVEKGQLLAQIHSPELVTLQQQFLTARSELNLAGFSRSRDKKLLQEGVIAERRWQETQAMYSSKAAIAHEAKQLLSIAGMSQAEIETLAKTQTLDTLLNVRSPIKGVVLERLAALGTRLDMQAPLYRIADLSELWLEINIPQERLNSLHIGDKVQIPDSDRQAKITLLGQSVDQSNQTILARAVIQGDAGNLRVGQQLNVQIMQTSPEVSFRVPNSAVAQNAGHSYVFVRNADGFAVIEVKVVGKENQDSLVTASGLSDNAQIAVEGAVALKANWLGLGGDE
ncbi:MAG: efflux RND transporter periplasmic adaptor subunit [Methylomonas sp.]|nr:efflux RND transporter periplasmic adaptor subunit [Methylomonas sp.]